MVNECYCFKVGTFDCAVVSDGTNTYHDPALPFFGNAPREPLDEALREHGFAQGEWTEYVSPYVGLAINTGDQSVLVDTGAGGRIGTTGELIRNLKGAGLTPEKINFVILTHGHADHIGGMLDSEGSPAFPNARYVIGKEEWDFWTGEPDLEKMGIADPIKERLIAVAQKNLAAVRDQVDLVDCETEIVPGVRAIPTPGHTPGHLVVAVSSAGEELLYLSDAALLPIHLEHPDWYAGVDLEPEQALASKKHLLERAVAEKALVQGFHFPFPGLGHITREAGAWHWEPIESTDRAV
jgi:glyoxylase-like metal-dependent hydrolase (beta-lactamase superfamily II)